MYSETGKMLSDVSRDNGRVFQSENSNDRLNQGDELIDIAFQIAASLKLKYTITTDFKLDKSGRPKLLEIYLLMPATSHLAYSADLNVALASVYLAIGQPLPEPVELNYGRCIHSCRRFMLRDASGKVVNHC